MTATKADREFFTRIEQAGLKLDRSTWLKRLLLHLLNLSLIAAISFGLFWLTLKVSWMFWPVVVLLLLLLLMVVLFVQSSRASARRRRDTAATTIKAASQGAVELTGHLKAIQGLQLFSETFNMPCFHLWGTASHRRHKRLGGQFTQKRSCLLDDGTGEVFIAADALDIFHGVASGKKIVNPISQQYMTEANVKQPGPYTVIEQLVPAQVPVRANGAFLTIRADESYLKAQARYHREPMPSDEKLQNSLVERHWRQYADQAITAAAPSVDTPRLHVLVRPTPHELIYLSSRDLQGNDAKAVSGAALFLWPTPILLALALLFNVVSVDALWALMQQFVAP